VFPAFVNPAALSKTKGVPDFEIRRAEAKVAIIRACATARSV